MDDYCEVTFEGTQGGTYYVTESQVKYINATNMVNTSSSTIYLYTSPQQGNNTYAISIPAFSYPRYSTGTGYSYITNAHNVSFNNRANFIRDFDMVEIVLLTLLSIVGLLNLMIRRRY